MCQKAQILVECKSPDIFFKSENFLKISKYSCLQSGKGQNVKILLFNSEKLFNTRKCIFLVEVWYMLH